MQDIKEWVLFDEYNNVVAYADSEAQAKLIKIELMQAMEVL